MPKREHCCETTFMNLYTYSERQLIDKQLMLLFKHYLLTKICVYGFRRSQAISTIHVKPEARSVEQNW